MLGRIKLTFCIHVYSSQEDCKLLFYCYSQKYSKTLHLHWAVLSLQNAYVKGYPGIFAKLFSSKVKYLSTKNKRQQGMGERLDN